MSGERELYEEGPGEEEVKRLEGLKYPDEASESILERYDLEGKTVLDAGSGPNSNLASFVERNKGKYFPLDLRMENLVKLRENVPNQDSFYGVVGDVRKMPYGDNSFDIVHERFVLMNIDPKTRMEALRENMRVSNDIVILLEYDWHAFKSSENPEFIENVKKTMFKALGRFSTDPHMGGKLEDLLKEAQIENYTIEHYTKGESEDYSDDLIATLQSLSAITQNVLKDEQLVAEITEIIDYLKTNKVVYSPPEIVAAIIKK